MVRGVLIFDCGGASGSSLIVVKHGLLGSFPVPRGTFVSVLCMLQGITLDHCGAAISSRYYSSKLLSSS